MKPTATADQPHGADERGRLAVLEQQAGRAGPERGEDPSVGLRRRQQHHGDGGPGEDPPRDFDTAESRQPHVQQHDVRLQSMGEGDRLVTGRRLVDDRDARFVVEQDAQARADETLAMGDTNADRADSTLIGASTRPRCRHAFAATTGGRHEKAHRHGEHSCVLAHAGPYPPARRLARASPRPRRAGPTKNQRLGFCLPSAGVIAAMPRTSLVVDDDPLFRSLARRTLIADGLVVTVEAFVRAVARVAGGGSALDPEVVGRMLGRVGRTVSSGV